MTDKPHNLESDTTARLASTESKTGLARIGKLLDRVGRILLCFVIAGAALFCLSTIRAMRDSDERHSRPLTEGSIPEEIDPIADMLNGVWVFADRPWSVEIREFSESEAFAKLNANVEVLKPQEKFDINEGVLALLDMLKAEREEHHGNVIFKLASESLQAVAFAPIDSPKQIRVARAVHKVSEDRWNFIQVIPNPNGGAGLSAKESPLLPRHELDARLAVRHDAQGRLCAEMIELNSDLDALQKLWVQEGWIVTVPNEETLSQIGKGDRPPVAQPQQLLMCSKGDQTIAVIVPHIEANVPQTLLMIRSVR